MTKPKTVDAYFEALDGPMAEVAHALRERLLARGDGLQIGLAWGFPCWTGNERVFSIIAHKSHCNLQLWSGARLTHVSDRITGTGKALRHVKLQDKIEVDEGLDVIIDAAIALDRTDPQKVR